MSILRIGTCSWKYPSWEGLVYSAPKGIDYLAEYAEKYDTVEIDQWFWSLHGPGKITLPRPETVREYAASVPPSFRFSVKVPNSITLSHYYRKTKTAPLEENPGFLSPELFLRFLDTLEPMHGLLGPLMLQFEYLNKQKMPSQTLFLERLEAFLDAVPHDFPIGIESRNPNYLNARYFSLLGEKQAHHVYLQGYYMPPAREVFAEAGPHETDVSVIRLHGPDRKGMEEKSGGEWNRLIEKRDADLQEIAEMTHALLSQDVDVYLNINNHFEGSAPRTIERLRTLLD
ncbi:MAG: DUF72 domain-containing protein [Bacteroidetes bacterium]|nr:DUF72 domain-containing protein [Bacteroidota bacterium]